MRMYLVRKNQLWHVLRFRSKLVSVFGTLEDSVAMHHTWRKEAIQERFEASLKSSLRESENFWTAEPNALKI